jgi:hypothetical protein
MKALVDLIDEVTFLQTILHYARRGRATDTIVEQAIVLVDRMIDYIKQSNETSWLTTAENLKAGLQEALAQPGGARAMKAPMPPGPEKTMVELPLVQKLALAGHDVRQQVRCDGGVVDIYDSTTETLIECKFGGTSGSLGEAAGQLARYRGSFPGANLTIAVYRLEYEARWLRDVLAEQGITVIEVREDE